ncbi:MAG: Uma2 family endonuclease [Cyanophyceae cyanobacterium]
MVALPDRLSVADYLALEATSPIKHEYWDGYLVAMAGASDAHLAIAGNLFAALLGHITPPCRVYMADMRLNIANKNRYFYPDLLITCDSRDVIITPENNYAKQFPKLIVEVLSETTEARDRGSKFFDYQRIEGLEEYVLINTNCQRVECFRRSTREDWILTAYTPDRADQFQLKSIAFTGTLTQLYRNAIAPPGPPIPNVNPPDPP